MDHNKINARQRVTVPHSVTVLDEGKYYTVPLCGKQKLQKFLCCNQKGGPTYQTLVDTIDLPGLAKKYKEQYRLHDRYNGRKL